MSRKVSHHWVLKGLMGTALPTGTGALRLRVLGGGLGTPDILSPQTFWEMLAGRLGTTTHTTVSDRTHGKL